MRSIIDEIAAAEQRADEIRAEASIGAREQIAQANDAASAALAELDRAERDKTREALLQAEREGEAEAYRMRGQMEAEADALCALAEKRIDEATAYLLKRVQSRA